MGFSSGFKWVGGFISQIHLDGLGLGGQVWIPRHHLGLGLGTWRSEVSETPGVSPTRGQGRLEKVPRPRPGMEKVRGFLSLWFLEPLFFKAQLGFLLLEFMWIKIDTKPEFALFVGNLLLGVFFLMPTRVLGLTSNEFKWNIHKAFMHLSYCVVLELSSRINGHQVGGSKKCWHRGRTVPNTSVQHPTWPSDISNRIVFFVCFLADTVSRVSCHSNFWCESPFLIAQHVIIDDHYIYIYIYIAYFTSLVVLLMEEILHQWRLVVYPIIYRVLLTPGSCLGFLPSTVWNYETPKASLNATWVSQQLSQLDCIRTCEKNSPKKNCGSFANFGMHCSSGWWLNQPIWKICARLRKSNWIISPGIGVKIPKIFELPPPSHLDTLRDYLQYHFTHLSKHWTISPAKWRRDLEKPFKRKRHLELSEGPSPKDFSISRSTSAVTST